ADEMAAGVAPADEARAGPGDPVRPVRLRDRGVPDRHGRVLHAGGRPQRGPGGPGPVDLRRRRAPAADPARQAGRPGRRQAAVDRRVRRGGGALLRLAPHRRHGRLRRDALGAGGLRDRGPQRAQRLPPRRLPAGHPGPRTGLHARGPQRRLHPRRRRERGRARPRAGRRTGDPAADRRPAGAERRDDRDRAPRRGSRRAHVGGRGRRHLRRRVAQQGFRRARSLQRRAGLQPGPAQHRGAALAGRAHGRPGGAAGLAVRDQHGAGGAAPGAGVPGRRLRGRLAACRPLVRYGVRGVLRGPGGHPRHRRMGLDRAHLGRAHHDHGRRALAVGRGLGADVGALGPPPPGRLPGRLGPGAPGGVDRLPRALHLPRPGVGDPGLGAHRRHGGRGRGPRAPRGPGRRAPPRPGGRARGRV
ncbi:MAG: hypothetical protein AVDCRST_MAG32-1229, partial [uncultured Nocardioides sp.]